VKFKGWFVAVMAVLALVACGSPTVDTVARLDNVILTRQDLDQRIARIEKGQQAQPQQGQAPSRLEIEQFLVEQFIDQNLVLGLARQRGIPVTDKDVDDLIGIFRDNIAQSGGGTFDEVIQNQLGLPGSDSTEFRQFASSFVARQKLSETLVTTDTVEAEMSQQLQAELSRTVMRATVAHILVATEEEANAVLDRLAKGETFEALAAELSTDPGSAQNGGVYENVEPGAFVPEFDKAMFEDLQPGETTETPVQTQFGYHIIKLISRAEGPAVTEEQAQQMIQQNLAQELQTQRQTALEKLMTDERAKATSEGRLVAPTYPTAVPAPEVQPPADPNAPQPTPDPNAPSQVEPTVQP
jgi:peptidyl-prolyl cis-trans isomerase C